MSIPLHPTQLARDDRRGKVVVAIAADLLFASRIRAAGQSTGVTIHLARMEGEAVEAARSPSAALVIVDLDARTPDPIALIRRLRDPAESVTAPVVAFVSHVRTEAVAAAREAGADRVLARSAFVRELPSLLAGL